MPDALRAHPAVDSFIATADAWRDEMQRLCDVMRSTGVQEDLKWGKPCYVNGSANIAIVQPMKRFLSLMFFQGALLTDEAGVLEEQGENTRSARRIRFTSVADVERLADTVAAYVDEAVEVAASGRTVGPAPEPDLVEELRKRLDADPELRAAFEALTPGRRREYHLHISSAKKAETRASRVEQHVERIKSGKGLRDR